MDPPELNIALASGRLNDIESGEDMGVEAGPKKLSTPDI